MPVNYGIKISEAGYDVKTADDENLTLKTDLTLLKVLASGTVNLSTSAFTALVHNLGYVPQFLVFWNDVSAGRTYLCTGYRSYGLARADTTRIYIGPAGAGDTAYYYLFYEQA